MLLGGSIPSAYAFLAAMMIFWLSLLAFESFIKWMIGK